MDLAPDGDSSCKQLLTVTTRSTPTTMLTVPQFYQQSIQRDGTLAPLTTASTDLSDNEDEDDPWLAVGKRLDESLREEYGPFLNMYGPPIARPATGDEPETAQAKRQFASQQHLVATGQALGVVSLGKDEDGRLSVATQAVPLTGQAEEPSKRRVASKSLSNQAPGSPQKLLGLAEQAAMAMLALNASVSDCEGVAERPSEPNVVEPAVIAEGSYEAALPEDRRSGLANTATERPGNLVSNERQLTVTARSASAPIVPVSRESPAPDVQSSTGYPVRDTGGHNTSAAQQVRRTRQSTRKRPVSRPGTATDSADLSGRQQDDDGEPPAKRTRLASRGARGRDPSQ